LLFWNTGPILKKRNSHLKDLVAGCEEERGHEETRSFRKVPPRGTPLTP